MGGSLACLGGKRRPLLDAEAMLLVDDRDDRETRKHDAFLDQRVGADRKVDASRPLSRVSRAAASSSSSGTEELVSSTGSGLRARGQMRLRR